MKSNNEHKRRRMYYKSLLSILVIFLIAFSFNCVWAGSGTQTSSDKIGPLLQNAIRDRSFSDKDLIKVIVVINRDHLKPLSEDIIEELKRRVEYLGGHIGNHAYNNVQVWIPIDKIDKLAEWDEIKMINTPLEPSINSITSEGTGLIGASEWNNSGFTGKGVKIGVVDKGFKGYDSLLGTELPSSLVTKVMGNDSYFLQTNHGTACAEIVHDVAPDAELFLVNAGDWNVDFHNAVSWLQSQGVDIISSSIGINLKVITKIMYDVLSTGDVNSFLGQSQYIVDLNDQWKSTINNAVLQGITWVQAAGNEGQKMWRGSFNDPDGNYYLNFINSENYNEIQLPPNLDYGEEVYVLMYWDLDHSGFTYDDYDLYITNQFGFIVASSTIRQSSFPYGEEACKFTPIPWVNYYAYVHRWLAAPQEITLLLGTDQLPNFKHYTVEKTVLLMPPANNPNVITVGAISYSYPYTIRLWSSWGPDGDGAIKPDLVAPDCVSTASWEGPFCGTSAATPHVAGLSALVKQAYPDWSPNQIKNYLESNAMDLGTPGKDNTYGSGLVQLPPIQPKANLIPYQPSGWSDKIVVSNITGTNIDSTPLYTTDTLYVDNAIKNSGLEATSALFYISLYVDGVLKEEWLIGDPPVNPNSWLQLRDYPIGSLSAGTHKIKIVFDTTGVIDEMNESDNEYTKIITVDSQTEPIYTLFPLDGEEFTACSYYNLPKFQWNTNEAFKSIEVQFSMQGDFSTNLVKVKGSPVVEELLIKSSTWKKVLLLPGIEGGIVYWRVVGTRPDKVKTKVYSNVFSMKIMKSGPVGNPRILPTSKTSLPSLFWKTNCNTKFKVWFYNDPDYYNDPTKPGVKKKALSFNINNPNDNGGIFTKELTSSQWTSIKKLVGDFSGETIYWHVESWDGIKRYSKSEIMSFGLSE
jgi:subtilisin family serine protease